MQEISIRKEEHAWGKTISFLGNEETVMVHSLRGAALLFFLLTSLEVGMTLTISIPPKHKVSEIVGFIKGKSAIQIARQFMNR